MKKFSSIAKVKVTEAPVEKAPNNDNDILKYKLERIINESLSVKIYGPIDPILQGTIKISGQELLVSALMEMIDSISLKDKKKMLESFVYNQIDINKSINDIDNRINESQTRSEIKKNIRRVEDLLEKGEGAFRSAETQANRITNAEKAYYRGLAAKEMISDKPKSADTLKRISDIFIGRAKELGYDVSDYINDKISNILK